jgi:6-phosphogluconolactonase (cycloisomerase 2 family)
MAVGGAGRFLYVLDRGHAEITGLHIQRDGSLEPSASAGSLPAFATGLAAY